MPARNCILPWLLSRETGLCFPGYETLNLKWRFWELWETQALCRSAWSWFCSHESQCPASTSFIWRLSIKLLMLYICPTLRLLVGAPLYLKQQTYGRKCTRQLSGCLSSSQGRRCVWLLLGSWWQWKATEKCFCHCLLLSNAAVLKCGICLCVISHCFCHM